MRLFDSHSQFQLQAILPMLSAAGIYGFAFFSLLSTGLAALCFWITVGVAILTSWKQFPTGNRTFFLSWILVLSFILLRTGMAVLFDGSRAPWHLQGAWEWSRLLLFPAVGLLCAGNVKICRRMLWLAMLGLLVGMIMNSDMATLAKAWEGRRTGFHHRIISFALYSGTTLFGLVCFAPKFWNAKRWKFIKVILWLLLTAVFGQGLAFTQSRGALLAFYSTSLFLIFLAYWIRPVGMADNMRRFKIGLLIGVVLLCAFTAFNWSFIERRWIQEKNTILQLPNFEFDKPTSTSVGRRAQLYLFGLQSVVQKPLWGYGPAESYYFIRESGRETLRVLNWKGEPQWWDHLHSTHLEILFHYGLLGYALFAWLIASLYRMVWHAWKEGRLDRSFTLFAVSSLTYMILWALFDFRSLHPDWRYYWNLLAGVLCGAALRPSAKSTLEVSK
ncbi:O-antigen ligase [Desulfacinum hydrothermale DSM 13146]|uniref:O-antigen ligase n=1 Tax=Desulfacinum hydrothermale DSM 13146 TaxID=1121390 RepID=A0A1W1X122_9BACT|nr:O-antigen ligase family protein [Desulfacinum hydrothermale]SMC17659.1 O-antigen ligase [Desulfacinum hydrothermale DSM 13146]